VEENSIDAVNGMRMRVRVNEILVLFGFGYCFTPTDIEAYQGQMVTVY
jgi:hypothetical protein